jgi:hypothetical protein
VVPEEELEKQREADCIQAFLSQVVFVTFSFVIASAIVASLSDTVWLQIPQEELDERRASLTMLKRYSL